MVITFKKDTELSYDGVNKRVYQAGQVYTPNHPRELSVFKHMIATGKADEVTSYTPDPKPNLPKQTKRTK
jgi:hypothetical protein